MQFFGRKLEACVAAGGFKKAQRIERGQLIRQGRFPPTIHIEPTVQHES
jgi:hypothetical protein